MKKIKLFSLVLILFVFSSVTFLGCKDKDTTPNTNNSNKTKTDLLVSSNWVISKATFNPPIVTTLGTQTFTFKELFEIPLIDSCQKDNKIIFKSDGTMMIDNGVKKCSPTEAQTAKDGNWKFINNETQIEITNSAYFSLINASKVILDQITVSETQLTGVTDYEFTNPITQIKVTSKVSFVFVK